MNPSMCCVVTMVYLLHKVCISDGVEYDGRVHTVWGVRLEKPCDVSPQCLKKNVNK